MSKMNYKSIKKIFETIRFNEFANITLIYFFWIGLHYVSPRLYSRFCVPASFYGFILSPFLATAPHCQAIRWVIFQSANQISLMWSTLGTWAVTKLTFGRNQT